MASVGREQPTDAAGLISIDALGPDGTYRTRNREPVTTTAGVAVAELSMVPPLYVSRAISAQRNARPLPVQEREAALAKAADAFATGVIAVGGMPATYSGVWSKPDRQRMQLAQD